MKKFKHGALFMLMMMLMAVADAATVNSSAAMWHEPECPEELLK
ncbi:AgrD family cyclic lactone autoinducer peptide [Clostridium aminobutyricum]|uniref:Cyclic lactone autoinducer peptide n=1 Tax=Clostridium aminobutyricum TaxID=33953 RepID=A0A939DAX5_CLOAM|nr:cyclic lactone autoinducer peptide [Clostridium aminobutyricum]MBN7774375.1 cyclic lactone autoinducer peptide [Clostridium aminobutyricum]